MKLAVHSISCGTMNSPTGTAKNRNASGNTRTRVTALPRTVRTVASIVSTNANWATLATLASSASSQPKPPAPTAASASVTGLDLDP